MLDSKMSHNKNKSRMRDLLISLKIKSWLTDVSRPDFFLWLPDLDNNDPTGCPDNVVPLVIDEDVVFVVWMFINNKSTIIKYKY